MDCFLFFLRHIHIDDSAICLTMPEYLFLNNSANFRFCCTLRTRLLCSVLLCYLHTEITNKLIREISRRKWNNQKCHGWSSIFFILDKNYRKVCVYVWFQNIVEPFSTRTLQNITTFIFMNNVFVLDFHIFYTLSNWIYLNNRSANICPLNSTTFTSCRLW